MNRMCTKVVLVCNSSEELRRGEQTGDKVVTEIMFFALEGGKMLRSVCVGRAYVTTIKRNLTCKVHTCFVLCIRACCSFHLMYSKWECEQKTYSIIGRLVKVPALVSCVGQPSSASLQVQCSSIILCSHFISKHE